jgi:hypothetical protein
MAVATLRRACARQAPDSAAPDDVREVLLGIRGAGERRHLCTHGAERGERLTSALRPRSRDREAILGPLRQHTHHDPIDRRGISAS